MPLVKHTSHDNGIIEISLNDPDRRNALGIEMFDALEVVLHQVSDDTRCLLLRGEGKVFCAGFDMKACAHDISILETYITKLSTLIRKLRRLHCPVVIAAQGAAIAGGCAVLTGGDFVVGEVRGKYGYPVHQFGISPAVTIPTLFQKIGNGRARTLLMGGELLNGNKALQIGILSHVAETHEDLWTKAISITDELASKPPIALQATKQWLNVLDGSGVDESFDQVAKYIYATDEAQRRLQSQRNTKPS